MENIIETKGLTKKYQKTTAVNYLNLRVERGEIYGFLGKNGAGKTTTIRLLMGLASPDKGEIYLFGREVEQNRQMINQEIGAIIEDPGLYENLTARENLIIQKQLYGCRSERIEEVLQTVGLEKTGKKKVKHFSKGMKQRLGIGLAILHEPDILILDEPTNGLDPTGIKEMRHLLKKMANEKEITIFISSHILSEIKQIADRVGIIREGKMIKEIDLEQFQPDQSYILLETDSLKHAEATLTKLDLKYSIVSSIESLNHLLKVFCKRDLNPLLVQKLMENGIKIYRLEPVSETLEDIFMSSMEVENLV